MGIGIVKVRIVPALKIGVCGVHGAGKTTKVHELRDRYIDAGNSVYVVEEIARSCPIRLGTIEAQEWIWEHQVQIRPGVCVFLFFCFTFLPKCKLKVKYNPMFWINPLYSGLPKSLYTFHYDVSATNDKKI